MKYLKKANRWELKFLGSLFGSIPDDDTGNDTSGGGGGADTGADSVDTAPESPTIDTVLAKPGSEALSRDEIKTLMAYDPVKVKAEAKKVEPVVTPNKSPPTAKTAPVKPGAKDAKVAPPAPPAPPPVNPDIAALTKVVQTLVTTPAGGDSKNDDANKPFYGGVTGQLEVDSRVLEAIASDDPKIQAAGISALTNGVANSVMKDALTYVHTQVIPHILKQAQDQAVNTYKAQAFESLMQAQHPVFKNPALRPMINQLGQQLIQAKQAAGHTVSFDKEFLDELTPAVLAYIQATTGGTGQDGNPVIEPTKRREVYSPTNRSRPPAESESFTQSADLMDMVGMAPRVRPN